MKTEGLSISQSLNGEQHLDGAAKDFEEKSGQQGWGKQ